MSQKLLNNKDFKNNQNYILGKVERQKVFFLYKFYNNKKFIKDYFETKIFFYIFSVFSGIFPYSIFASLIARIIGINSWYFIFIMFIFYFITSYFFYQIFIKNGFLKKTWVYILKKNSKKIFLEKYFEPKKRTYILKREVLDLLEKNYMILFIIEKNNKKSFRW